MGQLKPISRPFLFKSTVLLAFLASKRSNIQCSRALKTIRTSEGPGPCVVVDDQMMEKLWAISSKDTSWLACILRFFEIYTALDSSATRAISAPEGPR
ncbi:MAG: hypothetical protein COV52_04105 [Gammaproteobacteria bacterium CG11_big_fil_rev_8_21_14_0_20_46_22]|nr:MAG: hypothetical protein COW05_04300 [Gammaproteobacteria bacterium CG12_big_fil_rev_8_21_14_0_65_46_12]PIR11381.1 MAG: hypothetical protein COV52_04105 [Gammaproteobacteria bacterium CG11_big_fil_rev_8_21_14_0_20_46_22]